jgi:hypothetical protein
LGLNKHVNCFPFVRLDLLSSLHVPDAVLSRSAPLQVSDTPGYSPFGRHRLSTRWNHPFPSEMPLHSFRLVSLSFYASLTFLFRPARLIALAFKPVDSPTLHTGTKPPSRLMLDLHLSRRSVLPFSTYRAAPARTTRFHLGNLEMELDWAGGDTECRRRSFFSLFKYTSFASLYISKVSQQSYQQFSTHLLCSLPLFSDSEESARLYFRRFQLSKASRASPHRLRLYPFKIYRKNPYNV